MDDDEVPVTVTVVDALAVPVGPVQARLNVLVLVSPLIDSLPETALAPDQPPEAVQEVALVEDQTSVDVPPLVTDAGFPVRDTVVDSGDAAALQPLPVHNHHDPALFKAYTRP